MRSPTINISRVVLTYQHVMKNGGHQKGECQPIIPTHILLNPYSH